MKSDDINKITGQQIRAARALVRMSAQELADLARVGVATVRRSEAGDGPIAATNANESAIRDALEKAGVIFLPENGGGVGVRLKEASNREKS